MYVCMKNDVKVCLHAVLCDVNVCQNSLQSGICVGLNAVLCDIYVCLYRIISDMNVCLNSLYMPKLSTK